MKIDTLGRFTIISKDYLEVDAVYQGVTKHTSLREAQSKTLNNLRRILPSHFDTKAQPSARQVSDVFEVLCYTVPLDRGHVEANLRVSNDLGLFLSKANACFFGGQDMNPRKKELSQKLQSANGVLLEGVYCLGREGLTSPNNAELADTHHPAYQAVLNALLTESQLIPKHLVNPSFGPLVFSSDCNSVETILSDLSKAGMKNLYLSVGGLMEFLNNKYNQKKVLEAGQITAEAAIKYSLAEEPSATSETVQALKREGTVLLSQSQKIIDRLVLNYDRYREIHSK